MGIRGRKSELEGLASEKKRVEAVWAIHEPCEWAHDTRGPREPQACETGRENVDCFRKALCISLPLWGASRKEFGRQRILT